MPDQKIIAWFSCGITSAIACKLALDKYGKDKVIPIYIDINTAHPDNERFIRQCEGWYGTTILRRKSQKFNNQFEVIESYRDIKQFNETHCRLELKKKVRQAIEAEFNVEHQIFNYQFTLEEINKAIKFKQQYPTSKPLFPLIEEGIDKKGVIANLRKLRHRRMS